MSLKELLTKADYAFKAGSNESGLELLRQYIKLNPKDIEQLYRLAVIEEQIGSEENAKKAYLTCIEIANNFMVAYLYGGYLFQQSGEMEKALALYSLGEEQDARLTKLHSLKNASYETRLRSYEANKQLRIHFTHLHSSSVNNNDESQRVKNAIWPQTHNQPFEFLTAQQPHLFYIPELDAKPIYNTKKYSWCKLVEDNFNELTAEFTNLLTLIKRDGKPYLDNSYKNKGFDILAGSDNWTSLYLYQDGKANEKVLSIMPKTKEMLGKLPLYTVNNVPYEVFFSLLKPGQHITPHYGQSNHSLTVHLPIIVPDSGYLKVENKKIAWEEGKLIIFDDSYVHEAINTSSQDRVVLIFSIWHPDLSENEKNNILASFRARIDWLKNRKECLGLS